HVSQLRRECGEGVRLKVREHRDMPKLVVEGCRAHGRLLSLERVRAPLVDAIRRVRLDSTAVQRHVDSLMETGRRGQRGLQRARSRRTTQHAGQVVRAEIANRRSLAYDAWRNSFVLDMTMNVSGCWTYPEQTRTSRTLRRDPARLNMVRRSAQPPHKPVQFDPGGEPH